MNAGSNTPARGEQITRGAAPASSRQLEERAPDPEPRAPSPSSSRRRPTRPRRQPADGSLTAMRAEGTSLLTLVRTRSPGGAADGQIGSWMRERTARIQARVEWQERGRKAGTPRHLANNDATARDGFLVPSSRAAQ